jgi:uncharacterized membrane protein
MRTRLAVLIGLLLTAVAVVYAAVLYPSLPDQIPTHWNFRFEIDGWGDKQWAVFIMPVTMAVFVAMSVVLPWLSPRPFKIDTFRETFNYVMLLCVALFGWFHVVMLQVALNPALDGGRLLVSGLFMLLALIGNVLGKVRRNFWVGVRTPWTLANDTVWIATHRLAARLLVAAGLFGALAVWLGVPGVVCFVLLMVALLVPAFYSLVLYKRLEREGRA